MSASPMLKFLLFSSRQPPLVVTNLDTLVSRLNSAAVHVASGRRKGLERSIRWKNSWPIWIIIPYHFFCMCCDRAESQGFHGQPHHGYALRRLWRIHRRTIQAVCEFVDAHHIWHLNRWHIPWKQSPQGKITLRFGASHKWLVFWRSFMSRC